MPAVDLLRPVHLAFPSQIAPGLFQGPAPIHGFQHLGYDVVVLCAEEFQPLALPGRTRVLSCPLIDGRFRDGDQERAHLTARSCARYLMQAKKVLVTCMAGINRSGLVSALTLHYASGCSGAYALNRVRQARPGALGNMFFVRHLEQIPEHRAAPVR